jgi:hypothetical protein
MNIDKNMKLTFDILCFEWKSLVSELNFFF